MLHRNGHPRSIAALAISLVLLGGLAPAAVAGQSGLPPSGAGHRLPHASRLDLAGLATRTSPRGLQFAVSVRTNDPALAGAAIMATGGEVVNAGASLVEAYVRPEALRGLAGQPGVGAVTPIRRPVEHAFLAAGVALHGADVWQAAGYTGAGVRVGIIDGGFAGLPALLGTRIPGPVIGRCYAAVGSASSDLAACDGGDPHGAAVAETIAAAAPGVTLYVANPQSRLDELATVAWMTAAGVRIINASWTSGDVFEGPGDGTSPFTASTYALVDRAVSGGAMWVGAAGNGALDGWTGTWTDANGNAWLDFAPGDEDNRISLTAGDEITVGLRWNDAWGRATNAFDIGLYAAGGTDPLASATGSPSGANDPVRVFSFTAPGTGTYSLAVHRVSGSGAARLQILVDTNADAPLQYRDAAGTLATPADSRNPGMLTVGAVGTAAASVIEPYSSQGPTVDGRVKPDLVGADCTATTLVAAFCGTSQAAPFVAGAAALLAQANPGRTAVELAGIVVAHTVPLGAPVPNDVFGHGRVSLGPPPTAPTPAAPASAPPATTQAISGPAEARARQAMAATGSAVHVVYAAGAGAGSVLYRRSTDNGATFAAPIQLSDPGTGAGWSAVAAAGDLVVAAWQQADVPGFLPSAIWVRRSTDGGTSWAPAMPLTILPDQVGPPTVAADSAGHVLVAWTDAATGRIWTRASQDGGSTFGQPLTIGSTTLPSRSATPALDGAPSAALGSGGIGYVAWSSGPTRILLRRTTDGGTTWSPVFTVDAAATGSVEPWVSADGPGVVVVYGAPPARGRPTAIYLRRSADSGSHWTGRLVAASAATPLGAPAVTIKGLVMRLLYSQCVTGRCATTRLAYRQTGNGGSSWSAISFQTDGSSFAIGVGVAQTSRILLAFTESDSIAGPATLYFRIR